MFIFALSLSFLLKKISPWARRVVWAEPLSLFLFQISIHWQVSCLLAGPELLKCSIIMVFTCPLLSWCKISSPFIDHNNVVVFQFLFRIFIYLINLWFICLQGYFPIPRTRNFPDLYPIIRLLKRPLAFGTGRILIPGFIRYLPMLTVYGIDHSFPLGGVDRYFPFTEDETQGHVSYLFGTFRKFQIYLS